MCVYDTRQEEAWSGKSEARAVGRCTAERPDQKQKLVSLVLVTRTSEEWGVGVEPCSCLPNVRSALLSPDQIIRIRLLFQQRTDRPIIHSHATYAKHPCFSPDFFYPLPLFCGLGPLGGNASGMESRCRASELKLSPSLHQIEGRAWRGRGWHHGMLICNHLRDKETKISNWAPV